MRRVKSKEDKDLRKELEPIIARIRDFEKANPPREQSEEELVRLDARWGEIWREILSLIPTKK